MPRTRRAQQSTDPGRAASAASSSHSRPASVVAPSDLFCTGHTRYDLAGRLTTLTDGPRTITLGYDALGRRASLTHANGTQTTYAYDLASRLTGLTHATSGGTPLQTFTYGYDAADSRTSLSTLAQSLTYGYDFANRLTGATATPDTPVPSEAFTYDRVGNRLTGPDPANTYGYNAGHQLLAGPGAAYGYDANGNRTTKTDAAGTTTYTWDARDRLVQAVVQTATQTTTVTFAYDALGRRVRKTVAETTGGSTTTRTIDDVYDAEDVILAVETTDAGGTPTTVTTRYVHGPGIDEPLLVEQGGQVYAAHADALGSVTGLSDGSQMLAEASTYTSFGQPSRSGTATANTYAYTGREWEPELGLSYYRARYYDPEAGRFLSRDPIGFTGGDTNLYAYVMNDAVNHSDPSGLTWRTNTRFLWDFLTGSGDRERVYSSDDIQTLEMRKSLAAQKMRDVFRKAGCRDITNFAYGTYEAARDTLLNPQTADWSSTSAQVGGFARGSVINNGDGTVTFTIPNVAGTKSFFYHAVPERKGTSGPMRSIRQQFQWTERLEDCGC